MKNHFWYAMLGAMAFTSAMTLSGCSSEEVVNNPNYDSETGSVKTEFVFNVTQPQERTRQTNDAVGNYAFQGIYDMYLFCFDGAPTTTSTFDANHKFALDNFGKPDPFHNDADGTPNSSRVYTLYIPTGTQNFLFYGTANNTSKDGEPAYYGKLTKTYKNDITGVDNIKFNLVNRVEAATAYTDPQEYLLGILNGLAEVGITTPEELTWAGTSGTLNNELVALGSAYDRFIKQTSAESGDVRQGSGTAIRNMVGELFGAINDVYSNTSDPSAKALSKTILQKIGQFFTLSISGNEPNEVYNWANSYVDGTAASVTGYPENMPDGCAILEFTNGKFAFKNQGNSLSKVGVDYDDVTYPAELTYYSNSGIWQTAVAKEVSAYPTTAADWAKASDWTANGWNNSAVSPATRAVAMKENITYGVAQLKATIKRNSGNIFNDNANKITNGDLADNQFNGTSATGDNSISFEVTGILVGGQPDQAQYEYLPNGNSFNKVIYDNVFESYYGDEKQLPATSKDKTVMMNTLVLDNYTSKEEQDVVYIALELTADKSFYGKDGFIKAGEKFYLIGKLDPKEYAEGTSAIDWTKQTSFEEGDTGYGKDRVFVRDAVTTATFTIGVYALKNAYSTIPDLRSTQMLFGLSVDLEWKAGLIFNVVIN